MKLERTPTQVAGRIKPVALASVALCSALAAQAQDATQSLDTVVVTGIRKSLDTTLNLKRTATGLVDGIVAEDIGKFPDTNLAESMQRIAGVSIDRNASGEGNRVTVRGVGPDFNLVLLNGRQMPVAPINQLNAGASGSRAFDFANLASDSVSALEVFKTSRASSPTGGIGATINVKTARPLDSKERVASIGVKANYDASNNRLPAEFKGSSATPEISGIYSDTFADRTIGIALSASYSKRDSGSNKAYTQNGWRTFNAATQSAENGDWGAVPNSPANLITNRPKGLYSTSVDLRYVTTGLQRERLNTQAVLQFAPSKDVKFTLDHTASTNTVKAKEAEMSSWFNFSFGPTTFTTGGPVASPLVQTAEYPNNDHDLAVNTGKYAQKAKNGSTGVNLEWKYSDALKFELDGHHSTARTAPDSPFGTYSVMDLGMFSQGQAVAYYDQKLPILALPTTQFMASRLQLTGSQFTNNYSNQAVDQWQAKATYKLDSENKLLAGLGFTKVNDRRANRNHQHDDWSGVGLQGDYTNVAVKSTSLGGLYSQIPGHADSRLYSSFYYADFDNLRAQAIKVAMAKGTPTNGFAPMSQAEAEAYFQTTDFSAGNDWRTVEKSTAAYAQWDHAFDTEIPMNVSLGLRYESTKVNAQSQVVPRVSSSWGSSNEIALAAGTATFGSGQGKYSYVLPNIDFDADIAPNLKLRASFGENLGRPGFDTLLGGVSLNGNANAGGGSGSTGNPALKPLLSKNLDLSLEYYYTKSSYVAAGLFYKKVSNFIGTQIVNMTFPGLTTPIGGGYYKTALAACGGNTQPLCIRNYIFTNFANQPGVNYTGTNATGEKQGTISGLAGDPALVFQVTTPTNQAGDNIKGLELNAQHMFGNSGFGVSGNYTYVKTGLKFDNTSTGPQAPLLGVSNSANLVGFYEDSTWSVRAAYNWRGQFLAASGDGGGSNPVYTEPYGQVDVSVGYKIGKDLTIQADLINLNDGYIRQHGRTPEQLQSVIQTGRRFLIGARYRF
ncbi:TonB-dependent receptor [Roseateles sp.]|uniref:TonB-dependent receptor n=1 Tax=Roseateles sp. TaxID=1971397 RepID=UPI003953D3E7